MNFIAFSLNNRYMVIELNNNIIKVLNTESGVCLLTFISYNKLMNYIAFLFNSRYIALELNDNIIKL